MNTVYIFDVDGTLTPSRQKINENFKQWFLSFIDSYHVRLVSGSDYIKSIEQLGIDICTNVEAVYSCSGNDIWEHSENTFRSNWIIPGKLELFLYQLLQNNQYPNRTGNHIERRPGTVNFSIVGRNANYNERQNYIQWDITNNERQQLAKLIEFKFPTLYAVCGGETGIDIGPKNTDKRQVVSHFLPDDNIIFFGDKTEPGGNDYPLSQSISKYELGITVPVRNWKDTWEYLLTITS